MVYISVGDARDEGVKFMVDVWIDQAGGEIALAELERKFRKKYSFFNPAKYNPHEYTPAIRESFIIYKLVSGVVSQVD